MHGEQPLTRASASAPALSRPTSGSGRAAGLYGEVLTLPENRLAPRTDRKPPV